MVPSTRQNTFAFTLAIVALVAFGAPAVDSARIRRQAPPDLGSLNLTAIISALDLTPYLQNATTQVNQAVANLTAALQSQSPAIQEAAQQALEGLTNSTQDLSVNLEQFLTNFENQLSETGTQVSANLTNAINTLQAFYETNGPQLQSLINSVGGDIANATQTLQADIATLNAFLQSGLTNLTQYTSSSVDQSIASLQAALNAGALNQTLASIVTNFDGQALNFQQAFAALQEQAGPSFQTQLTNIQHAMSSFSGFFQSLIQSLFQNVQVLISPN